LEWQVILRHYPKVVAAPARADTLNRHYPGSPAMAPTAPRTPAEHHYDLEESGLADLDQVGFDDAGRTVEVLVALAHATLASRRSSQTRTTAADSRTDPQAPRVGGDGRVGSWRGVMSRFQLPPFEPCMRFSRTRLTDVLHRRCSDARQPRSGLGATTIPLSLTSPRRSGER
jgi:hypothetical protein